VGLIDDLAMGRGRQRSTLGLVASPTRHVRDATISTISTILSTLYGTPDTCIPQFNNRHVRQIGESHPGLGVIQTIEICPKLDVEGSTPGVV
jgi:hypothetical protein